MQGHSAAKNSTQSVSVTLNHPPDPAHTLIVVAGTYPRPPAMPVVLDNASNVYLQIPVSVTTTGGATLTVFYAHGFQTMDPFTVTATASTASELTMSVLEYAGIDPASPIDAVHAGSGFSAMPDSGSIATAVDGELYLGIASHDDQVQTMHGPEYVLREVATDDIMFVPLVTEDKSGMSQTTSAMFELTAASAWGCLIVTFRPAP